MAENQFEGSALGMIETRGFSAMVEAADGPPLIEGQKASKLDRSRNEGIPEPGTQQRCRLTVD